MSTIRNFKAAWKDYFGKNPTKGEFKRNYPYWKQSIK